MGGTSGAELRSSGGDADFHSAGRIGRLRRDIDRIAGQFAGKAMIDVAMMHLVLADHQHHVTQRRVRRQLPIMFGDLRSGPVDVAPASISAR